MKMPKSISLNRAVSDGNYRDREEKLQVLKPSARLLDIGENMKENRIYRELAKFLCAKNLLGDYTVDSIEKYYEKTHEICTSTINIFNRLESMIRTLKNADFKYQILFDIQNALTLDNDSSEEESSDTPIYLKKTAGAKKELLNETRQAFYNLMETVAKLIETKHFNSLSHSESMLYYQAFNLWRYPFNRDDNNYLQE